MPIVSCVRDDLFSKIGRQFTETEFRDVCLRFGIELDDITSEAKQAEESGAKVEGKELSDEILYKIEVAANRYDLLCVEGIARAIRTFLGLGEEPEYTVVKPAKMLQMTNHSKQTGGVRKFVVAAVLRGFRMDEKIYKSLIDLQDKLHANICRKRTLVAIGTHDLDTIQGPFSYEALPWDDIKFRPLSEEKEFTVTELFPYFEHKPQCHLAPYLHITKGSPLHPVIYDSKRTVLSLPPIINGEHSKITQSTKNILIECTGTDYTKTHIVLSTMVAMMSGYCKVPFSVEPVEVVDEVSGNIDVTPHMDDQVFHVTSSYVCTRIGTPQLSVEEVRSLISRMGMPATYSSDAEDGLVVRVPVTRSDILAPCDIAEDVAIAYGYNNIVSSVPKSATIGGELPINKLTDANRHILAECGFFEALTWVLCSEAENFDHMRQPRTEHVSIGNPTTAEFTILRTSLLPGLLKVVEANCGVYPLPMRIFEISDIVMLDKSTETGARNCRRLAAVVAGLELTFEVLHGALDRFMTVNNVEWLENGDEVMAKRAKAAVKDAKDTKDAKEEKKQKSTYFLSPSSNPSFFPGRGGDIYYNFKKVGTIGQLHPEVLANFNIDICVVAGMELDLRAFL